jgi:hypothetical protein
MAFVSVISLEYFCIKLPKKARQKEPVFGRFSENYKKITGPASGPGCVLKCAGFWAQKNCPKIAGPGAGLYKKKPNSQPK